MGNLLRSGILLMALVLSACATGPTLQASLASVPPIPANEGRVFFYRGNLIFGVAIQPSIRLNGQTIGQAIPGGVFYRDLKPGHYVVDMTAMSDHAIPFDLAAGQTVYIRTRDNESFEPKIIEPGIGQRQAEPLSLISGN